MQGGVGEKSTCSFLWGGALYSRHHDCGFKVSCTPFMYTSTLKPLPAYQLSKAIASLFMGCAKFGMTDD